MKIMQPVFSLTNFFSKEIVNKFFLVDLCVIKIYLAVVFFKKKLDKVGE